ncbi:MAG: recombinase family protein [Bacteroidota bacterium]
MQITDFIITEVSRLSRADRLDETLKMEARIISTGVKIGFAEQHIDTDTDEGNLMKNLSYVFANFESKKIGKRTKYGQKGRILNGYRPFARPMGYKP